jgi:hypothetical protein
MILAANGKKEIGFLSSAPVCRAYTICKNPAIFSILPVLI